MAATMAAQQALLACRRLSIRRLDCRAPIMWEPEAGCRAAEHGHACRPLYMPGAPATAMMDTAQWTDLMRTKRKKNSFTIR